MFWLNFLLLWRKWWFSLLVWSYRFRLLCCWRWALPWLWTFPIWRNYHFSKFHLKCWVYFLLLLLPFFFLLIELFYLIHNAFLFFSSNWTNGTFNFHVLIPRSISSLISYNFIFFKWPYWWTQILLMSLLGWVACILSISFRCLVLVVNSS